MLQVLILPLPWNSFRKFCLPDRDLGPGAARRLRARGKALRHGDAAAHAQAMTHSIPKNSHAFPTKIFRAKVSATALEN